MALRGGESLLVHVCLLVLWVDGIELAVLVEVVLLALNRDCLQAGKGFNFLGLDKILVGG